MSFSIMPICPVGMISAHKFRTNNKGDQGRIYPLLDLLHSFFELIYNFVCFHWFSRFTHFISSLS